jgi:hypothetical protein
LTDKGRDLAPAVVALTQWGDRWVSAAPPVNVTDAAGRPVEPVGITAAGRVLSPGELRFQPGPGAAPDTRAFLWLMAQRRA